MFLSFVIIVFVVRMDAEKCLKSVYYTPSNEGSFGGKKRLKEAVFKDTGIRMSDKQVSERLAGEDAYTLHKPAQMNYKRNRVIVHGLSIFNFKQTWLICLCTQRRMTTSNIC